MPRDYKIGIVVGLLAVIVVGAYFIATDKDDTPQPAAQTTPEERPNEIVYPGAGGTSTGNTAVPTELEGMPEDPSEDEVAADIGMAEVAVGESAGTADVDFDRSAVPVLRAETPAPATETVDAGVDPAAAAEDAWGGEGAAWDLSDDADDTLASPDPEPVDLADMPERTTTDTTRTYGSRWDTPPTTSGRTTGTVEVATAGPEMTSVRTASPTRSTTGIASMAGSGTYKVAEDDTAGYWGISKKVYGTSKYYGLIEKANPNVDPRRMRPGTTLVIPPKPTETTTSVAGGATASQQGQFTTNAAGQRVYTVGADDTGGLWGIAVKAYGKGYLNTEIAKANPSVDSDRLNPGDKLIIPPAPAETPVQSGGVTAAVRAARAQQGTTIMEGGQRYYVIAAGEQGYWSAAEKIYGHGKYMTVLRDANPALDPQMLRPGQKILAPPLPPEATRTRSTTASSGTVVAEPVRRGRVPMPDFGP